MAVGQTLMGHYGIPARVDSPLNLVVNPVGDAARSAPEVWNTGDFRRWGFVFGCRTLCM